jgi:DNA-binding CsgD family transcriptional regulator
MTFNNTAPSAPPELSFAAQRLNQLQADVVTTARILAVDEVGAAIAHQLNEPLTALLLYLHEMKERAGYLAQPETARTSIREMVESALRETERACEIMKRFRPATGTPVNAETAVVRGRELIVSWMRSSNTKGASPPATVSNFRRYRLTPREHEVLALIVNGASNKEGGHRLGISTRTFELHRAHIMEKYDAKNAADLIRIVLSQGQLDPRAG